MCPRRSARAGLFARRHVPAVSDVSFALQFAGPEIFTIVGQSGSGKTTLARMILGMEVPTHGAIRLLGQDLGHVRGAQARRLFMAHRAANLPEPIRGVQSAASTRSTICS